MVINVICMDCGLVFQSPRMTDTESKSFYANEYRPLYQGQPGPSLKDLAVQTARAKVALGFILNQVKSTSNALDIGCSTGILLKQLQAQYHCAVRGIEPGDEYRQYAQTLGLEVVSSLEELQPAANGHFDLVSMMHVLEHLPDPVGYLENLRENLLDPGGWLMLEVPNLYAHDCFEVAHLVSFSAHTLAQVIKKAGFRVVQLRAHGAPRSSLLPLYIILLAQPDISAHYSLEPDHAVRLHRQMGFFRRRIAERLFPTRAWIPFDRI